MKLVYNREEFKKTYYYKKCDISENDYPIKYPCIVTFQYIDGGIDGPYVVHKLFYPPMISHRDTTSFMAGLKAAGLE